MSGIKNISKASQPREKIKKNGSRNLSDQELLSVLLQSGSKEMSVSRISQNLLEKYGSIKQISKQTFGELSSNAGIGDAKACILLSIVEIANRVERIEELKKITCSEDVYELIKYYRNFDKEHFIVICLNNKSQVICYNHLTVGSIDEMTISPKEVFNYALTNNAKALIIAHNHPSGDPTPSEADIRSTKSLIEIGYVVGIPVIDHIIIAVNQYNSLKQKYGIIFMRK